MLRLHTTAQLPLSWVSRRRFWKRLRRRGILASKGLGGVEMLHCVAGQVFSIVLKDWTAAFFRIQQSKCLALAHIYIYVYTLPFTSISCETQPYDYPSRCTKTLPSAYQ